MFSFVFLPFNANFKKPIKRIPFYTVNNEYILRYTQGTLKMRKE